MNKSTTNLVLILITLAAIGFLLGNLVMNSIGMKVEIDPILAGFMSSIIGFIIAKKGGKKDGGQVAIEIEKHKQAIANNKDPINKIDDLLGITK